ncbi:MAG: hypothetical protein A3E25_11360 [Burkholderiales bacterium RIFCSPHIGHO2_12_FULL_69_20]|nr:MAG: hypothetical protein A3E25_11360 [Burkholderiales bacterium RIFCSPHIGHO2_12_FULL_69_20]
MHRRLYVYYRVPEPALAATVKAVRTMQATLTAAHPGLQAELLRRPELRDGEVTLMETYGGNITPAMQATIEQAASALPQPRHTESFHPL